MSDEMKSIDEVVAAVEAATVEGLRNSSDASLEPLLDQAVVLFEPFPYSSQTTAMAFLLGMLFASIEGQTSQFETDGHGLMGYKERLRIFNAQVEVVFREAYAFRAHPDCPPSPNDPTVM